MVGPCFGQLSIGQSSLLFETPAHFSEQLEFSQFNYFSPLCKTQKYGFKYDLIDKFMKFSCAPKKRLLAFSQQELLFNKHNSKSL